MKLKFNDGMEFDTSGSLRVTRRSDGVYVIGQGIMQAVNSYEDGQDLIKRIASEELIRELFENFPEASSAMSPVQCISWNYKNFIFKFVDTDSGKEYTVNLAKAVEGFAKFQADLKAGKFPGLNVNAYNYLDAGAWDAYDIATMVQYALFGEALYG